MNQETPLNAAPLLGLLEYLEKPGVIRVGMPELEPHKKVFPIARAANLVVGTGIFGWSLNPKGKDFLKVLRLLRKVENEKTLT
jgi:hypothetical protein